MSNATGELELVQEVGISVVGIMVGIDIMGGRLISRLYNSLTLIYIWDRAVQL